MKLLRTAVCAVVCLLAAGAIGQTSPGDTVVNVPFDFSVGGKKLPAGHYIVAQRNDTIRVFNSHTEGFYAPAHPAVRTKADGSKLVFHRYGDSYFLAEVWVTGNTTGKELFPSQAEREVKSREAEMQLAVVRPVQ